MNELDELIEVFCRIKKPEMMKAFFNEIFTPAERHDFGLRWESIKRVDAGVPQREIAKDLGISLCKITRASKVLKSKKSVSKKLIDAKK